MKNEKMKKINFYICYCTERSPKITFILDFLFSFSSIFKVERFSKSLFSPVSKLFALTRQ